MEIKCDIHALKNASGEPNKRYYLIPTAAQLLLPRTSMIVFYTNDHK